MKFYRIECRDKNEALVAVREVPMKNESHRAIKSMHTRLLNWALTRPDFEAHYTEIYHIERK